MDFNWFIEIVDDVADGFLSLLAIVLALFSFLKNVIVRFSLLITLPLWIIPYLIWKTNADLAPDP